MRLPEPDEVPLAALEVVATPVAVVGALAVVVLGGLAATAARIGAQSAGAGATGAAVVTNLLAVLTLAALLAAAAGVLEAYRRRFARTGGGSHLLVGLFVPGILVVVPLVLAASWGLGAGSPPWWLLAIAAVGAHAVAFRTVAMYSMPDARRRPGSLVAAVAAFPAALALAVEVQTWGSDSSVAVASARLAAGVDAVGVPVSGIALVAVPLAVSIGYAAYRTHTAPEGSSAPAQTSLPRSPTLPQPSRVPDASLRGTASHLRDHLAGVVPGLDGTGRGSSAGSNGAGGPSRPPVSASSSGGRSGGSTGRSAGSKRSDRGGAGGSSRRSGGGASSGSSSGSSRGSSDGSSSGSSGGSSASSPDESSDDRDRSDRGVRKIGGSSRGSGSGGSSDSGASTGSSTGGGSSGSGRSSGASAGGSSDDGESGGDGAGGGDGSGSDTRIFTGDFGSYGDDTVDVCPACEESIPSDGVYRFCPFCGEEL